MAIPPTTAPPKQYALPNCREFLGRRIRLQWSNEPDHVYFRLMAKTRDDEYAALGELGSFVNSYNSQLKLYAVREARARERKLLSKILLRTTISQIISC